MCHVQPILLCNLRSNLVACFWMAHLEPTSIRALKVWQIFGTNARSKLALLTNELHFSICLATTLLSVFRYLDLHDYVYLPVACCQMSLPLALIACIAPPAE